MSKQNKKNNSTKLSQYLWRPGTVATGAILTCIFWNPEMYSEHTTRSAKDAAALGAFLLTLIWLTGIIRLFDRSDARGKMLLVIAMIFIIMTWLAAFFFRGYPFD